MIVLYVYKVVGQKKTANKVFSNLICTIRAEMTGVVIVAGNNKGAYFYGGGNDEMMVLNDDEQCQWM